MGQKITLPIQPFALKGKRLVIPVDELVPGKDEANSISIPRALVAFLDILGFGSKKDARDMEYALLDFVGPLTTVAEKFGTVRVNVFSDCAFLAAPLERAADLISGLRFAFEGWASDGIMVRGGLALGSYCETQAHAVSSAPKNLIGSLFAGSGVTGAVREEARGGGALLFATQACAEYLQGTFSEPIYDSHGRRVVGWTDKDAVLYWFTGISAIRMLRRLEKGAGSDDSVVRKLRENLVYACNATRSGLPFALIVAILSSPIPTEAGRSRAVKVLGLKDPADFDALDASTKAWLDEPRKWQFLQAMAELDSSIDADLEGTSRRSDHLEGGVDVQKATEQVARPVRASRGRLAPSLPEREDEEGFDRQREEPR